MRTSRSVDTCSRSSFRMAVTRVREVPARRAISACVSPCRRAICFRRCSNAFCTCYSLGAVAGSPRAAARTSGVLAIIGFSRGIEEAPFWALRASLRTPANGRAGSWMEDLRRTTPLCQM